MAGRLPISICAALAMGAGCKSHADGAPETPPDEAGLVESKPSVPTAPHETPPTGPWSALARFPKTEAVRVVLLPTRSKEPRFEVGGPVLAGDVAVVSSSQLGFMAVDWRTGEIAWSKPSGSHVAPPAVLASGEIALLGECYQPPKAPDRVVGCLRIVSQEGQDHDYIAVHGPKLATFADSKGVQKVWATDARHLAWRRGDEAILIDVGSGVGEPIHVLEPPLAVHGMTKDWIVRHDADQTIEAEGDPPWHTQKSYDQLVGVVYLPDQSPMVRAASATTYGGASEITLFDMDATGSMHGQVAFPVPGIAILGSASSTLGDAALAVRLDTSLEHDYIVGYAANAYLTWVYALPDMPRTDPVGVAVGSEAVIVFHDGDTVTVLPELSAPPTAPGAASSSLENTTP